DRGLRVGVGVLFFSSRRRHTRSKRDWSSDVCSSDLRVFSALVSPENTLASFRRALDDGAQLLECDVHLSADGELVVMHDQTIDRSEERRVGKEWRARGRREQEEEERGGEART